MNLNNIFRFLLLCLFVYNTAQLKAAVSPFNIGHVKQLPFEVAVADTFVTKKKEPAETKTPGLMEKYSKESTIFSIIGLAGLLLIPGGGLIFSLISMSKNKKIKELIGRGEIPSADVKEKLSLTQIFNIIATVFHSIFLLAVLLYIAIILLLILTFGI